MKKLVSWLFLAVFLFNLGGYFLVFVVLNIRAEQEIQKNLDVGDYSDLVSYEFAVPLKLPYPVNQKGYVRANGSFEQGGEFYHLVKQKMENDTLYLVCVKDHDRKHRELVLRDFTQLANDLPSSTSHALSLLSKLIKDYTFETTIQPMAVNSWSFEIEMTDWLLSVTQPLLEVSSPPPEGLS